MADIIEFHFTMGPVQGFVSQSRRTRDLWASSYLLSYLAEKAIRAVAGLGEGAKIVLPDYDPEENRSPRRGEVPHGTFPNRFVAHVTDEELATKAGKVATEAVKAEWEAIADGVWKQFVEPVVDNGNGVRAIWERQIANFWDINWVAGTEPKLLDRRKNWRTRPAGVEPGDHCTMMGDWQELSGLIYGKDYARGGRRKDEDNPFWVALRGQVGQLDLGPDERLCAIALVKRLYPKAKLAQFKDLDASAWSSTLYLAAVPWLAEIVNSADARKLRAAVRYVETIEREAVSNSIFGERQNAIASLHRKHGASGGLTSLDGNFFFANALENANATPLGFGPDDGERDREARKNIGKALSELYKAVDSKPSPFYALLLMDGDSMGKLIAKAGDDFSLVSSGLTKFTSGVPAIVRKHDGVTVYAGGDDVLAMLPAKNALACAIELERSYVPSFDEKLRGEASISGAIVYAHYRVPLRTVLDTAHHLLDDVAKDQTGRASLAVGVFKSSGLSSKWAAPWAHLVPGGDRETNIIDELVEVFRGEGEGRELSSSFFYNIRERFALLTDRTLREPGEYGTLIEGLDFVDVLLADYLRGREKWDDDGNRLTSEQVREQARARMQQLLAISQRVRRVEGKVRPPDEDTLGIDGALLVRFLASEGKEIER